MIILRRESLLTITLCGLLVAATQGGAATAQGSAATAQVVAATTAGGERVADTWRLEDLYASLGDWEKAKASIRSDIGTISECKGRLGESAKRLAACMERMAATRKQLSRFYTYAGMGSDQDTRVQKALGRRQAAGLLFTKYSEAASFLDPELLAIGEKRLTGFLKAEPRLNDYRFYIENTLRQAKHKLSEEGESVIAATGNITRAPSEIYSTLANAEIDWPTITLSDGTEARLDQAGYVKHRQAANRDDRKKVFDAYWGAWKKYERTVGTMLNAAVNAHHFRVGVRSYGNSLLSAIDHANIPEAVYRTLIAETNGNLDILHRYFRLRARMLGIDDLRYYDVYPPLIELDRKFSLDEGKAITLAAFAPMGEEYVDVVRRGFNARWMDAYPRPGKRSGAYMSGSAYDV
ncbi:MAG: M3 family metallopeptidase, partial [Acidobacteria bacterium]|nr:M3 family metallopeptidase [Acidobacteriota bacterium]